VNRSGCWAQVVSRTCCPVTVIASAWCPSSVVGSVQLVKEHDDGIDDLVDAEPVKPTSWWNVAFVAVIAGAGPQRPAEHRKPSIQPGGLRDGAASMGKPSKMLPPGTDGSNLVFNPDGTVTTKDGVPVPVSTYVPPPGALDGYVSRLCTRAAQYVE
jgi:hypothetical protein